MTPERFEREHAADWQALTALLDRARGRPRRLGAARVLELGARYRAAVADLARARHLFPAEAFTATLEALVVRARQAVYADSGRGRASPRQFFAALYWREVRALGPALAVSAAVFGAALALGMLWGATDPGAAGGLVPGEFIDGADPPRGDRELSGSEAAAFSSAIFTNNIQVALTCFAAGLLLAVGGVALLLFNGLVIGAVFGIAQSAGNLAAVAGLVAAHGVLELSCIVVAGAAGLRLGWAIVEPGHRTRAEALAATARPAMMVVLGTAPWLVLAGLVEGFVSPAGWSVGATWALGLALGTVYWALVATAGGPHRRYQRVWRFARR